MSYLPERPVWKRARHARQLLPRLLPQMPRHVGRGDAQCMLTLRNDDISSRDLELGHFGLKELNVKTVLEPIADDLIPQSILQCHYFNVKNKGGKKTPVCSHIFPL